MNQQQNPVEGNAIKWLKRHSKVLLDRTNAPPQAWLKAQQYLANVHNHTAKENLRWNIPLTVRHGETRDISHLLMFQFYEPVYYHQTSSFPDSEERLGYWVGSADNVGDALCHCIIDAETKRFHETATVRPVSIKHPNWRIGVPNKVLPRQGVTATEDKAEPSTADTEELEFANAVSYTHLTLPTIYSV